MDVTEFRIIRPPVQDTLGNLLLPDAVPDPRQGDVKERVLPPIAFSNIPDEAGPPETDPLERQHAGADTLLLARFYTLLNELNDFLRRTNDWVKGPAVTVEIKRLVNPPFTDGQWALAFAAARVCITEHIVQAMVQSNPGSLARAEALTRLALIADLIAADPTVMSALTDAEVFARLNQRTVTLPAGRSSSITETARVQLIREATVSDMHVIRREWASYVLGEVANIRNLMHGETFTQTQTSLRERELTATIDSERQEQTEQEDSSKLASEMSQEIDTQLNLSVNGYVDASVQYKTPVATINVAGGASVGLSMQRGEKFASKVAREAVTRAVRRVDTRTRETRSQRELTRNEDVTRYELSNEGDSQNAVYRWVDRVDRYQLFRYPDRLQLEFQLPEPAEFHRKRAKATASAASAVNKPPETFNLTLDEIKPEKLVELATKYQASNLPTLSDEEISLARTVTIDIPKESLPAFNANEFNCPTMSKELDIAIPNNYQAVSLTYSGHGYPVWGNWRYGSTTIAANKEGFHSGFAAVSVGSQTRVSWVGGFRTISSTLEYLTSYGTNTDKGSVEVLQATDQSGTDPVRSVPYGRAMLVIGDDTGGDLQPDAVSYITFEPGVAVSLRVGLSTAGLSGSMVTFFIKCKRSNEALMQWQLSVYDALFAAWSQWKREYAAAEMRRTLVNGSAGDAGSSQRNEQVIREELKRQVISWLLNEEEFSGRPALRSDNNDANFRSIDFNQSRLSAPTIQFLEQAFEWGNMMYMFYPYFWAAGGDWSALAEQTANDPEFERFLRAGSARVVVPARPGFNDAVKNWLIHQVPFVTGQLPAPNDDLFVAIDREIRDLTAPWEGGIAEDWWEARVSTTMLYLDADAEFPVKNDGAALPVEKNTKFVPKLLAE